MAIMGDEFDYERRRLEDSATTNETDAQGDDFIDETGANEGSVIVDTLRVYGSIFLVLFTLFLCLRRKYRRYFQVRSWSPKIRCQLADDPHGFIRWMWELYFVKDNVILEQCGMDALCFLRSIYFGAKLCLMGIANAVWLMPIYATSGNASEAPSKLVQVSTSYVPSGSNRFYATVLAAYILFLYTMYLILQEFNWYTQYRHEFLMQKKPRNYAAYVTGIPPEYQSSYALKEYFRQCFSREGVLEAHVAMEIPDLDRKVRQRKRIVKSLEHALALERLRGIMPVQQSVNLSNGRIVQRELKEVYEEQLEQLNEEVNDAQRKIKFRNDRMQDIFRRTRATRSNLSAEEADSKIALDNNEDMDGSNHDDGEEEDEFTNMNWQEYRNFKLFPLTPPVDSPDGGFRRRRLSTIESLGSPFSMGSPDSGSSVSDSASSLIMDDSSIHDDGGGDIETGFQPHTSLATISMGDDHELVMTPPTRDGGHSSFANVGIFQSNDETQSQGEPANLVAASIDPDDPSAVFANLFFGAGLPVTPSPREPDSLADSTDNNETPTAAPMEPSPETEQESREIADTPLSVFAPRSSDQEDNSEIVDEQQAYQLPNAVTIPPVKTKDDEPFNCPNEPISYDPATTDDTCLVHEDAVPTIESSSGSQLPEASSSTVQSSDSDLLEEENDDSCRTDSERSSRRSIGQVTKLGSDHAKRVVVGGSQIALRASSTVVKEGSDKMKKVVVDGSQHAIRTSSIAVKEGSEKVKKAVVDSSGQVKKVVVDGSEGVKKVVKDGSHQVTKRMKEVNPENFRKATDFGVKGVKKATGAGVTTFVKAKDAGVGNVKNFASYVLGSGDGTPLDSGFVVFSKLSTTHAALQMIHHPRPFVMDVQEAPDPDDIYWRNVGMPHKAKQVGKLISLGLSGLLCLTWTIPVSFISSLTEVDALRESVPFIDDMLTRAPWMQVILEQLAPLLLMGLNAFLPVLLRFISTFEGHIASSALEASLFQKMAAFQIIQTFFVSALSGGIWAELSNILKNPESIIDLLARSLPAQSTYFIQIILVDTFVGLSAELLRVIPLGMAFLRRMVGPNLTEKERNSVYMMLHPLSDPWEFQHAEIFGEGVLYFVVLFVYATIAPITCFFLLFCWMLMGSCYRHQFVYNYGTTPDSGGKMWSSFIGICLICMLIAQFTLVGLLALKKAPIQSLLMIPLITITILFNFYIGMKHFYVTCHLPTRLCLQLDRKHYANGGLDFGFVRNKYLQPALLEREVHSSASEQRQVSRGADDSASECSSRRVARSIRIRV